VAVALAVAALAGACGGGPADEVVARHVGDACNAAGIERTGGLLAGTPNQNDLLRILSRYNALDARLDAIDARGDAADRVDRLRTALLGVRDGFARLYDAAGQPPGGRTPQPPDGGPTKPFARLARAAAAMPAPSCGPGPMGQAGFERFSRLLAAETRLAGPTGKYTVDAGRACRRLPRSLSLEPRPAHPGRARAWALEVRQALQTFEAEMTLMDPPPAARGAHQRALEYVRADIDLVGSYADTTGTKARQELVAMAESHAGIVKDIREAMADAGVDCTR
jgi:hypothetical protein